MEKFWIVWVGTPSVPSYYFATALGALQNNNPVCFKTRKEAEAAAQACAKNGYVANILVCVGRYTKPQPPPIWEDAE